MRIHARIQPTTKRQHHRQYNTVRGATPQHVERGAQKNTYLATHPQGVAGVRASQHGRAAASAAAHVL